MLPWFQIKWTCITEYHTLDSNITLLSSPSSWNVPRVSWCHTPLSFPPTLWWVLPSLLWVHLSKLSPKHWHFLGLKLWPSHLPACMLIPWPFYIMMISKLTSQPWFFSWTLDHHSSAIYIFTWTSYKHLKVNIPQINSHISSLACYYSHLPCAHIWQNKNAFLHLGMWFMNPQTHMLCTHTKVFGRLTQKYLKCYIRT